MEPSFEGLCSGGPMDGQKLTSRWQRVTIPIVLREKPGIGAGYYEFKADAQMWVWKGG